MRQNGLTMAEHAARAETLRRACSPRDFALARELFLEYAQWLQVDLCFQGFEEEVSTLPGAYAPPRGRLLLAGPPDAAFGCIALRPLDAGSSGRCDEPARRDDALAAEIKRLYVQPARRGEGWGQRLTRALLDEARAIGYRELKLDTLGWMTAARSLYSGLGFRECAPYYANPLAGVVYMSLTL
jgi:ribosomal protein S18 acetylase RimI-like enzyme